MTYALSWPLQQALYALLATDGEITTLAPGGVFDEPPHEVDPAAAPGPYVVLGGETVEPWFDKTAQGAVHTLRLSVHGDAEGFSALKQIAGRLSDLLIDADPGLSRGRVVNANFAAGATAKADQGRRRRIDLRFRFVVEDDGAV